jgi:hypothetical protein
MTTGEVPNLEARAQALMPSLAPARGRASARRESGRGSPNAHLFRLEPGRGFAVLSVAGYARPIRRSSPAGTKEDR